MGLPDEKNVSCKVLQGVSIASSRKGKEQKDLQYMSIELATTKAVPFHPTCSKAFFENLSLCTISRTLTALPT
jgi:hypothetical protein